MGLLIVGRWSAYVVFVACVRLWRAIAYCMRIWRSMGVPMSVCMRVCVSLYEREREVQMSACVSVSVCAFLNERVNFLICRCMVIHVRIYGRCVVL
jgi:hypothetical protein